MDRKAELELWAKAGMPGDPPDEYLHFREADGSITTKRLMECTRADHQRHIGQLKDALRREEFAFAQWERGEISSAELDKVFTEYELLYGATSWEHS